MRKFWKVLGFLFNFLSPFIIVYLNHAVMVDGGIDVDVMGLLIVLIALFGLYKYIEHKKNVNEIQDKNAMFRVVWSGGKRILFSVVLWWLLITIDDNIEKLVITVQLLTLTFILGFIFNILGNRK